MTRSTKMEKARQLNAARGLLQRQIALPEAVRRLSREFDLSERQAYRYLQEASNSVTDRSSRSHCADHLEASTANRGTAAEMRETQWPDHWSDRSQRLKCISARPKKAWLNRVKIAAHFKFKFLIRLIACSSRSSRGLTRFWCHVASTP
jgi:hypothetical protein